MSKQYKIGILNYWVYENTKFFRPWIDELDAQLFLYRDYDIDWLPSEKIDLLITHLHYQEPEASILINAMSQQIPVLILADGILEYRNTWDKPITPSQNGTLEYQQIWYNPIPPGSIFQPVLGHKIASLGRSHARLLESWGNLGKCEIVGLPRLDKYFARKPRQRKQDEPFRILVATANSPWFTEKQMHEVKQSLTDLKLWFSNNPEIDGVKILPLWRLTQNLGEKLGVESPISDLHGTEMAAILETVDAMITTPSTSMLEGMLQGIPVAILDYNNCPHFVPAAWTITASSHIEQVISDLLSPPSPRMLYQDTILHDALECQTPAQNRMIQLVESMIKIGRTCKAENQPLQFPTRIIQDVQNGHHLPEKRFDLQELFPKYPVFGNTDLACLQVENLHLKLEISKLQTNLNHIQASVNESFSRKLRRRFARLKHLIGAY